MDEQAHNLNALLLATGEFSLAPSAATVAAAQAAGFRDFGNIVLTGFNPENVKLEHKGSYRGVKRVDKTLFPELKLTYKIQVDEIGVEVWKLIVFGQDATDFTQSVQAAVSGDALAFNTTAAVIGRWYDLMVSGVRIRRITTVTIADKVEGTDFVLDKLTGRIRFLTAQAAALTPTITAPAITATDVGAMSGLTPLVNTRQSGIGRLYLFNEDHPATHVFEHADFGCDVFFESIDDVDGENITKATLNVQVTTPVGKVLAVE